MSFDIAKSEPSTPLATCMWGWCMCQVCIWIYLISRKKELSCTYSSNNSGMQSLWALIIFFSPSFDEFVYQNTSEFLQLRPGCSVDLFNNSYFSDCGKLVFPFIRSSDCTADCPCRQEVYGKKSDFWLRSCTITLFTDCDSIGKRQDIKVFPSLPILTHFIYMTSTETLNVLVNPLNSFHRRCKKNSRNSSQAIMK